VAGRKPIFFFGHILAVKSITCNLLSSLPYFIRIDPKAYLLCKIVMLSRFVAVRLANPRKHHYFRRLGHALRDGIGQRADGVGRNAIALLDCILSGVPACLEVSLWTGWR